MLAVVGSSLKMLKFESTTPNMSQHGGQTHAIGCANNVAICCVGMLRSFAGALQDFKNNEKVQLGDSKSGRGRLWERSLTVAFHYKVSRLLFTVEL